ncbi:MAG: hypothetical protein ABJA60_09195, partial [Nitrosospira sp.]
SFAPIATLVQRKTKHYTSPLPTRPAKMQLRFFSQPGGFFRGCSPEFHDIESYDDWHKTNRNGRIAAFKIAFKSKMGEGDV